MPTDRGASSVGRPSDPVWQYFKKLATPLPPSHVEEDGTTATFARPRARCIACGCIMIGQVRQLKAHHARCGSRRHSPSSPSAPAQDDVNEGNDSVDAAENELSRIPSIKHQLSAAEKLLVVKCHAYFKAEKQKEKFLVHRNPPWQTRDRVSKCLGMSQKTVSQVIAEWNRHQDPTFQVPLLLAPCPPSTASQPAATTAATSCSMQQLGEYAHDVDAYIQHRHAAELPVTAAVLCAHLMDLHCQHVDVAKMRLFLRRRGYVSGPRINGRRCLIRPTSPRPL
ncbi:hypothetical protein H257_17682 [Aphanomyces astaci]|uniref:Uncharacterized protein n=1 Tax=Aphanomyces astaci TaxID=112090 RepID=W4FFW8_APHAT|nr:hypothetical protein H257_17682 [Aphanomyces astaci]ETV65623.1 hypothetical protein H257_17682 [Aphanomyces astaci]|eukprot:XP_009844862.1 hypothetical protein H257_17682 [Aphanomyces astaci]